MLNPTPRFQSCIGIDYSGAADPDKSLPGLRAAQCIPGGSVDDIVRGDGRHWSRRTLAEWLDSQLAGEIPILIGIDHGLGFPEIWRQTHGLPNEWDRVLDRFCARWPTDQAGATVRSLREMPPGGMGNELGGDPRWRRIAERRARAKSVFHFDVPGSVATSTHAGLPWIRWLRTRHRTRLHCWPFDGWIPEPGKSVLTEAWPAFWNQTVPLPGESRDRHDARVVAQSLADAVADRSIDGWWEPELSPEEWKIASGEGWILGVG